MLAASVVINCDAPMCPDCEDGDPCTIGTCIGGACTVVPACDDGDPCTVDVCSPDGTCSSEPACDDGDPCTQDTCTRSGVCGFTNGYDANIECTLDTCNADGTCTSVPQDSACALPGACITSACLVPPTPGPNQTVVPGPVGGCFHLLDHGYCTNTWDGCACNGSEICVVGPAGDVVSGCAPLLNA